MKKMFLAGPFKSLVDPDTHIMSHKNIKQLQSIIEYFEERGWSVHCAHKREKWGREFMTPVQCTLIDYEEISQCDYFVAFPGIPASPGTHIEMGWASAMKKPVVLLLEENEEYAFLVQGLGEITSVKTLRYNKEAGVDIPQIEALIDEFEGIYEPI
ncbi:nucleoside 2-deoxyribosyltransferase [Xenorhabdus sp. Reich]|uniref:Nucleoside 2-deoxyribosyltransferase n=1 Tax=Xenorhabdus littoralis TaxID=2582835 RepID=A0ABU4SKZ1_9GAMM|nr:nucleoside 2-deoxyribosyltransferase [Xenorhabdus sp. Reich]MDX7999244.1 nucleoside 2-deoxyribosyltransferase [Xenorhabdus sp. Reich]